MQNFIFVQNTMRAPFDVDIFTAEHTELTEIILIKKRLWVYGFEGSFVMFGAVWGWLGTFSVVLGTV